MKEQLILSICARAMAIMPTETAQDLKRILESELQMYDVSISCTALVPYSGPPEQLRLYLASKCLDGLSKLTLDRYKARLTHFCQSIHKDITDIDSMDIRAYLAAYSQTGVMASTLATAQTIIKSFFQWLENEDRVAKSPMRKIKPPKTPSRKHKFLTTAQMELLRMACRDTRDRAILETYYSTGCRVSELYNADKSAINWSSGAINVVGKGDKERTVYINARAMIHLQKYLTERNDFNQSLFITSNKPYSRLCVKAIQDVFKRLGQTAKIDKVHPHLMRHTVATTMLQNGADLSDIQKMLGHTSPATTQMYAETNDATVMAAHRRCS